MGMANGYGYCEWLTDTANRYVKQVWLTGMANGYGYLEWLMGMAHEYG